MFNKAVFAAFLDTTNHVYSKLKKLNNSNGNNNNILNLSKFQYLQNNNSKNNFNKDFNKMNLNDTNANFLICNSYLYIDNFFDSSIDIFSAFILYKIVISILCLLLGMFFIIVGYRFLKMSTFLTGFTTGTMIIYFILNEHRILNFYENLIIAISIGVLFALVSLLVQYIGIFLLGVTSSSILICFVLIIIDLFYKNNSIWLCISLLFFCAIILASLTLKFQKSMSILNTSIIGSALFTSGIDYFIEKNYLMDHIYDLLKVKNSRIVIDSFKNEETSKSSNTLSIQSKLLPLTNTSNITSNSSILLTRLKTNAVIQQILINPPPHPQSIFESLNLIAQKIYDRTNLCWYSWFIFSGFFFLSIFGVLIQGLVTGRLYDHKNSWQQLIRNRRKAKSADLEKIRRKSRFPTNKYNDDHEIQSDGYTEHSIGSNCNVTNFTRLPLSPIIGSLKNSRNMMPMVNEVKKSNDKAKTTSSLSPFSTDELPANSVKEKSELLSLNYASSNISLSPLLNLKSAATTNNKNLIKQQISSKDNTEKFRFFYQIRRNNGDVLCKEFLKHLQKQSKEQQKKEEKTKKDRNISNLTPESTSLSGTNCNVQRIYKFDKKCSKKSTNSNSSVSTTTTITRVI